MFSKNTNSMCIFLTFTDSNGAASDVSRVQHMNGFSIESRTTGRD